MSQVVTAYIGIGANLNQPIAQIEKGIIALHLCPDLAVDAISPLYTSKPVGPQDQPDFINGVIKLRTRLSPDALLATLQEMEYNQGRQRVQVWGPRVIDLDILFYGEQKIEQPDLVVPHKEIANRGFVLLPLRDLMGDTALPCGMGQLSTLIEQCPNMALEKIDHVINIETLSMTTEEDES